MTHKTALLALTSALLVQPAMASISVEKAQDIFEQGVNSMTKPLLDPLLVGMEKDKFYHLKRNGEKMYFSLGKKQELVGLIQFNQTNENTVNYTGELLVNDTAAPEMVTKIFSTFNNFAFTGEISDNNGEVAHEHTLALKDAVEFSNEEGTLSVLPYRLHHSYNYTLDRLQFDYLIKGITMVGENEANDNPATCDAKTYDPSVSCPATPYSKQTFIFDDFTSKGDLFYNITKLKALSVESAPAGGKFMLSGLTNIAQTQHVNATKKNDFSNKLSIKSLKVTGNPMFMLDWVDLKFDTQYQITDKVSLKELSKIAIKPYEEQKAMLTTIIEHPTNTQVYFGFKEQTFTNFLSVDIATTKVHIDKIENRSKNQDSSKAMMISDFIDGFQLKISAHLSPKYAMYTMMAPPPAQPFLTKQPDGSVKMVFNHVDLQGLITQMTAKK
jgi:hypothetical protein